MNLYDEKRVLHFEEGVAYKKFDENGEMYFVIVGQNFEKEVRDGAYVHAILSAWTPIFNKKLEEV